MNDVGSVTPPPAQATHDMPPTAGRTFRIAWQWRVPAVITGIAAGALQFYSPGAMFVLLFALVIGTLVYACGRTVDRRFLATLFVMGFIIRAGLSLGLDALACMIEGQPPMKMGPVSATGLNIVDHTRRSLKMGDSDYYSERGYAMAQRARGVEGVIPRYYRGVYGQHGYLYVIGAFYYLFDYSPVAVKLVNCLLGALLGPLMFLLVQRCFHATIARWAALAVTFFPSLVLWSVTNLKEPSLLLLTAILLLLYIRMRAAKTFNTAARAGALFLVTALVHMTMRSALYTWTLVGCVLLAHGLTCRIRRVWKYLLLGVLLVGLLASQPHLQVGLAQAFLRHIGHVTTPGTFYTYLPPRFYSPGYVEQWKQTGAIDLTIFVSIGRAVFHYLLEPLPSRIGHMFLLVVFPQMVLWYLAMPLMVLGLVASARWNREGSLFLLLVLLSWTLIGSLTNGNVGTVFRVRDMVTPFYLVFTCAGAWLVCYGPASAMGTQDTPHAD